VPCLLHEDGEMHNVMYPNNLKPEAGYIWSSVFCKSVIMLGLQSDVLEGLTPYYNQVYGNLTTTTISCHTRTALSTLLHHTVPNRLHKDIEVPPVFAA
jgi:hypothetical protein